MQFQVFNSLSINLFLPCALAWGIKPFDSSSPKVYVMVEAKAWKS
jgi:hypothetical protein